MYSTLQNGEIRLLHLEGGPFDSVIGCRLEVVSLDKKPVYRALSYVWGDASNKPMTIIVNGTRFGVTVNLELALRRLRAHGNGAVVTLWADAVCINQDDVDERGKQVALMGRIYKSCTDVCVWLGPLGCEDEPSCLGWQALSTEEFSTDPTSKASGLMHCARNLVAFASGGDVHVKHLAPNAPGTEGLAEVMAVAMKDLATSVWFTRAWVVQEAHLAPKTTVFFGNVALSRELLWDSYSNRRRLVETCNCCRAGEGAELSEATGKFIAGLTGLAVIRDPAGLQGPHEVSTDPNMGLLEYTILKRRQQCSDPRDRIYAYQGVIEDWLEKLEVKLEEADYSGDMQAKAAELYLRVCSDAVMKRQTLEFLAWDTTKHSYKNNLPSWSLDWTHDGSSWDAVRLYDSKRWDSAKGIPFRADIVDGTTLVSAGRRIDTVAKVGERWRNDEALCQNWHDVTGLRGSRDPDSPYPSGGTWGDTWWKVLCFVSENTTTPYTERDIRAFELVNAIVPNVHFNYLPKTKISDDCGRMGFEFSEKSMTKMFEDSINPIIGYMLIRLDNQVLFITENGYMGFGRHGVREGDPVFLLGGCRAPLVLRETGKTVRVKGLKDGQLLNEEPLLELIAGCFIYGIMDGELSNHEKPFDTESVCVG